ncbi:hypothetical protein [Desulfosporosinus nitroreducens]|uniref:Uncharacterized protein n=1 Tax=Desulfosporosinus nitroreducens TaxID=2018668 RepID=A0ABT8QMV8_9FIRM|nr:hypothetical protein [Desulfosporosinus nitroreducens]MDO0821954.1 hypothetical protein [Desulfosporosinus nitroreducens]
MRLTSRVNTTVSGYPLTMPETCHSGVACYAINPAKPGGVRTDMFIVYGLVTREAKGLGFVGREAIVRCKIIVLSL